MKLPSYVRTKALADELFPEPEAALAAFSGREHPHWLAEYEAQKNLCLVMEWLRDRHTKIYKRAAHTFFYDLAKRFTNLIRKNATSATPAPITARPPGRAETAQTSDSMTAYHTTILDQLHAFFNKPRGVVKTLGPDRLRILDAADALAALRDENTGLIADHAEELAKVEDRVETLSTLLCNITEKARVIYDLQAGGDDIAPSDWEALHIPLIAAEAA